MVLPDQRERRASGGRSLTTVARRGGACLLALLTVGGCGGVDREPSFTPPDADAALAALDACPTGDLPWMDAFKAARDAERLDELPERAQTLVQRCAGWQAIWFEGRALLGVERRDEARTRFEEAQRRAWAVDDAVGMARSADQLGWIAYEAGQPREGREHYAAAIAAAEQAGRDDLLGFARSNLAGLLMDDGDFAGAIDQLEAAEDPLRRAGRPDAVLGLAYNRATLLLELGDAVAARTLLERIHSDAEAMSDAWTVDASALVLGNLHMALRAPGSARDWYAQVSERFADLHLLALWGRGRVALEDDDLERALDLLQEAARGANEQEHLFAGMADIYLTEAEMRAGRLEAAEERLARWIDGPEGEVPAEVAAGARWMLGRVRLAAGRANAAVAPLEEAVGMLEQQSAALDPLFEGLRFLRQRRDPYVDLAVAIAAAGGEDHEARVLQWTSRAKARGLQRTLRESGEATVADLASVRAGLVEGECVLDYLIGDERGILVAISRDEARAIPIAGRRDLAEDLAAFRSALGGGTGDATSAGRRLRQALLEPAMSQLDGARRLYVVPDDALALIPFEALPEPDGGFLGDALEVAVLPLAGRPLRVSGPRAPLLLAGQPVFAAGTEFSELPWAAFELSKLRERWGEARTTLLTGADLTRERMVGLPLGEFRTVHLATHAVASTVDPRRCGVVLSGGERLGLDGIVGLPLDGSLVVLSACRTGEGELIPGEGIVGLGWAFLRAGASAVVTSLWSVDDAVSARLMVGFHDRLAAGDDPVAALAAARRETARLHPDPTHWAPFVIVIRPE